MKKQYKFLDDFCGDLSWRVNDLAKEGWVVEFVNQSWGDQRSWITVTMSKEITDATT